MSLGKRTKAEYAANAKGESCGIDTVRSKTESKVAKTTSLLSFGNVVMLTLTLNCGNSCRSQSSGSKGEASISAIIALAAALPGVEESSRAASVARFRRPPVAERVGMKDLLGVDVTGVDVTVGNTGAVDCCLIGPTVVKVSRGALGIVVTWSGCVGEFGGGRAGIKGGGE